jgi:hypothetical protein
MEAGWMALYMKGRMRISNKTGFSIRAVLGYNLHARFRTTSMPMPLKSGLEQL